MKVIIVLSIVIVPLLGQLIQPTITEPPAITNTPQKITPRVVNGKLASAAQFPWQVSIQAVNNLGNALSRCSGSLVTSNRILTAAHCIRDYATFKIGFGSINLNTPQYSQITYRSDVIIHPRFNNVTLNNDIAIVKLKYDVQLGTMIKVIRLPRRAQNGTDYFVNKAATISGWGRTDDRTNVVSDVLRFANLNVTANAYCKSIYGNAVVVNSTVCGLGIPATSGPCGGDSGSPLVLTDVDGITTQIGIFSFVASYGCSYGLPAGFTQVASYLDWISQNTGIPIRN